MLGIQYKCNYASVFAQRRGSPVGKFSLSVLNMKPVSHINDLLMSRMQQQVRLCRGKYPFIVTPRSDTVNTNLYSLSAAIAALPSWVDIQGGTKGGNFPVHGEV